MLKLDYLTNVLNQLDGSGSWELKLIFSRLPKSFMKATDLLILPSTYITKMRSSISKFTYEELEDLSIEDFIEQLSGESFDKVMKLITIAKKKQSLEQDFN